MKKQYFSALNYTLGDEDTSVELELLPFKSSNVFSIAGSGGRVLPLFSKEPICLNCVDILKEQLFITELRVESIKSLNYLEYCKFWGYTNNDITPNERQNIFTKINISNEARSYLEGFFSQNRWTKIIYMGKFEKMLIKLSKVNNLLTGKKGRDIFYSDTLEDQRCYYIKSFPHLYWKIVLLLLGNSTVLNSILYKGDFPKKNIAGSTYSNFNRIFGNLFQNINLKYSFFAQLAFWGEIRFPQGYLLEVDTELFYKIKVGITKCKVNYIQGDIFDVINNSEEKASFVSLSDVPSFISNDKENNYLQLIHNKLEKDAVTVVRGNLRVTNPNYDKYIKIIDQIDSIQKKELTQLWQIQIYKKV